MSAKSWASKILARQVLKKIRRESVDAVKCQQNVFHTLICDARQTVFGRDHSFQDIDSHQDFVSAVPIREYEAFESYINRWKQGESDVLWKGKPLYFCKTSGTTSGTKYIPLTRESMPNHINSARNALLCYIGETNQSAFVDGKMIFLQGSPELSHLPSGIPYGRLSGIVANHVPSYLQRNRMPSYATNCIEDWETKVNVIADETIGQPMSLISGIPNWVQMYFEILLKKTGKQNIREIFPDFNLFVYGGVNFEPYRMKFKELIGADIPSIELYPASEGFIAYQDSRESDGLLLNVNSGIFFEFVEADQLNQIGAKRLTIGEVRTGVNYAIILSTNAGLWSYLIGDTVRFVSLSPPRIKVTGRIKHYTSAFGEHVIAEEVESAMRVACTSQGIHISEFHVAPQVNPNDGLPYHEWFVETDQLPDDKKTFASILDNKLQEQNVYYKDLITGHVLKPAVVRFVKPGTFNAYMKANGKLGGQNKVPRLANDRKIAESLVGGMIAE